MIKANGTRFGTPGSDKHVPARSRAGRQCEEPGCSTLLSTYNASQRCYLHTAPTYRHPLQRS